MHMFLETEGPFPAPPTFAQTERTLIGIGLPEDVLRKIYCENFQRLAGTAPAPLNRRAAYEECERLASILEGAGRNADEVHHIAQVIAASAG
jgi:hypothetical protein